VTLRALLGERALAGCLGTSAVTAVPAALAARTMPVPCPPAALPIWLLVGGYTVDAAAAARVLGPALAELLALRLVTTQDALLIPTASIAAIGAGLIVSDVSVRPERAAQPRVEGQRTVANELSPSTRRRFAPARSGRSGVPWPDDSSLHLFHSLPTGPLGAWLDVGTGAAVAPLAAGPRAAHVRGTDVDPHALERAAQGARLSGRADLELRQADLLDGAAGTAWDLITFNAPIPDGHAPGAPATAWYTYAPEAALIERFWSGAADHLRSSPTAEVLAHTAIDADPLAAHAGRRGRITVARSTPAAEPGFAITRWQPHAPDEQRVVDVALGPGRPYITRAAMDPDPDQR
jgi:hypothetical protein